jgi:hypothetical protein
LTGDGCLNRLESPYPGLVGKMIVSGEINEIVSLKPVVSGNRDKLSLLFDN